MNRSALPVAILFALTLSACATAPKEEVATAPEPVVEQVAEVEPVVAPEVVAEPALAPQAEEAKPVVKKRPKRVFKPRPKPVEPAPAPMVEPEPMPEPVVTPVPEPVAPVVVATPVAPVKEAGFFEQYWIWLVGLVIAAGVILLLVRKQD